MLLYVWPEVLYQAPSIAGTDYLKCVLEVTCLLSYNIILFNSCKIENSVLFSSPPQAFWSWKYIYKDETEEENEEKMLRLAGKRETREVRLTEEIVKARTVIRKKWSFFSQSGPRSNPHSVRWVTVTKHVNKKKSFLYL